MKSLMAEIEEGVYDEKIKDEINKHELSIFTTYNEQYIDDLVKCLMESSTKSLYDDENENKIASKLSSFYTYINENLGIKAISKNEINYINIDYKNHYICIKQFYSDENIVTGAILLQETPKNCKKIEF